MSFGYVPATAFFVLLLCAATTSFMALLEVVTHSIKDFFSVSQKTATYLAGASTWFVGISSVFSFNLWRDVYPLSWFDFFMQKNIFSTFDYLLTNVLLILGGLLIAIFTGWAVTKKVQHEQLKFANQFQFWLWRFLLCIVCPITLCYVLLAHHIN